MDKLKKMKVIILTVMLVFVFYGCGKKLKDTHEIKKTENKDFISKMEDFTIVKTKNGKTIWEIKARYAIIDDNNKTILIKQGKLKIFDNNTFVANVVFNSARYDSTTDNIFLQGENVITTVENEKIIAYDINYIHNENKIFSDKEVKIYKGNNLIKGVGFETFDGFQNIRIYKNVVTTE